MIGIPNNPHVVAQKENLSDPLIDGLEATEAAHVREVGNRADTASLIVTDGDTGKLLAYAILGVDAGDMVTIYAANVFLPGLGKYALQALLGASKVVGKPMRVHTEKVRTMAAAMGAKEALEGIDLDGVSMGVFHG